MFEEYSSAIPSIWESMNSWFTPTVLFVLLNVVIGTIAFTSTLTNTKQNQHQEGENSQNDHQQQTIDRSPSVLRRLKSINFYRSQNAQEKTVSDGESESEMETEIQNFEAHSQYFFQHPSDQESFQENLETPDEQTQHMISQQDLVFEEEKVTHLDFEQAHEEKVEKIELQRMDEVDGEVKDSHHHVTRTKSDAEPASGEIPVKLPARMRKSASLKSAFGHFEEDNDVEERRPQTARENGNKKLTEDDGVDAKADDFILKFKNQLKLQRMDSDIRYDDMRTGK